MKLNREQQAMVEANMPLVGFAINKYMKSAPMEYEDMVSVGYISLCKAVQKYNPNSGTKFSTYAVMTIVRGIQRDMLPLRRKKRGAGYVTLSYDKILEDVNERSVRELILGYEPDFSNEVVNRIVYEPIWKLCPTHKMMCDSPLTSRQLAKKEGVTAAALFARRKIEFERAKSYLKHIGIKDAVQEGA